MTPTQIVPARPAWPRNLGRAVRDAAAAVGLGVVIGLAYARVSEWPADPVQGGQAQPEFIASLAGPADFPREPADARRAPDEGLTACPSSPSVAPATAPSPACHRRVD